MLNREPAVRGSQLAIAVALALAASACGAPSLTSSPAATPSPLAPTASVAPPQASPTASDLPSESVPSATAINLVDLVGIEVDLSTAAVLCEQDPDENDEDGGRSMDCSGAVRDGVAAIGQVRPGRVVRVYLDRPACTECSPDESNLATAYAWLDDGVTIAAALDGRTDVALVSSAGDASGIWPEPGSSESPPVAGGGGAVSPAGGRPLVLRPTTAISSREPYPYCGSTDTAVPDPDDTVEEACFLDAVIAGRPAELIATVYGIEGGTFTWLYRHDATGPVQRYEHGPDVKPGWPGSDGLLILHRADTGWDFSPLPS